MNGNTIEVFFRHPLTSELLPADLSPQCTGQEALEELQADDGTGAFLSQPQTGQQYKLVLRHGEDEGIDIPPKMTFDDVGVKDGDTVEVQIGGVGAWCARRKG
ncbi:MAG TPA: hypothetical protein VGA87_10530 [Pyrinomonadaceae bacterium]|jgi:hypothetical protein